MTQCTNFDGRGRRCAHDAGEKFKHCERCRVRSRTNRAKSRLNTKTAAFEQLINKHGYRQDHPEARRLAEWLTHPNQKCAICGVSNSFLETLQRTNGPFPFWGYPSHWRRLHLDHIDVGRKGEPDATNFRPLCAACNQTRGSGRLTDAQVLYKVRREWLKLFAERQLKWLA